ncbi:uncharacterized protein LOC144943219 isoform X1 [Lampetra fluviatilis]
MEHESLVAFEENYQEMRDWAQDLRAAMSRSRAVETNGQPVAGRLEKCSREMRLWQRGRRELSERAAALLQRLPSLGPLVEARLLVLAGEWDWLEAWLGRRGAAEGEGGGVPPGPRPAPPPPPPPPLQDEIRELRAWLRETELFIFNSCLLQAPASRDLPTKRLDAFKALCQEVGQRRAAVVAALGRCRTALSGQGPALSPDERQGLQAAAVNLSRRWDAIVSQAQQWRRQLVVCAVDVGDMDSMSVETLLIPDQVMDWDVTDAPNDLIHHGGGIQERLRTGTQPVPISANSARSSAGVKGAETERRSECRGSGSEGLGPRILHSPPQDTAPPDGDPRGEHGNGAATDGPRRVAMNHLELLAQLAGEGVGGSCCQLPTHSHNSTSNNTNNNHANSQSDTSDGRDVSPRASTGETAKWDDCGFTADVVCTAKSENESISSLQRSPKPTRSALAEDANAILQGREYADGQRGPRGTRSISISDEVHNSCVRRFAPPRINKTSALVEAPRRLGGDGGPNPARFLAGDESARESGVSASREEGPLDPPAASCEDSDGAVLTTTGVSAQERHVGASASTGPEVSDTNGCRHATQDECQAVAGGNGDVFVSTPPEQQQQQQNAVLSLTTLSLIQKLQEIQSPLCAARKETSAAPVIDSVVLSFSDGHPVHQRWSDSGGGHRGQRLSEMIANDADSGVVCPEITTERTIDSNGGQTSPLTALAYSVEINKDRSPLPEEHCTSLGANTLPPDKPSLVCGGINSSCNNGSVSAAHSASEDVAPVRFEEGEEATNKMEIMAHKRDDAQPSVEGDRYRHDPQIQSFDENRKGNSSSCHYNTKGRLSAGPLLRRKRKQGNSSTESEKMNRNRAAPDRQMGEDERGNDVAGRAGGSGFGEQSREASGRTSPQADSNSAAHRLFDLTCNKTDGALSPFSTVESRGSDGAADSRAAGAFNLFTDEGVGAGDGAPSSTAPRSGRSGVPLATMHHSERNKGNPRQMSTGQLSHPTAVDIPNLNCAREDSHLISSSSSSEIHEAGDQCDAASHKVEDKLVHDFVMEIIDMASAALRNVESQDREGPTGPGSAALIREKILEHSQRPLRLRKGDFYSYLSLSSHDSDCGELGSCEDERCPSPPLPDYRMPCHGTGGRASTTRGDGGRTAAACCAHGALDEVGDLHFGAWEEEDDDQWEHGPLHGDKEASLSSKDGRDADRYDPSAVCETSGGARGFRETHNVEKDTLTRRVLNPSELATDGDGEKINCGISPGCGSIQTEDSRSSAMKGHVARENIAAQKCQVRSCFVETGERVANAHLSRGDCRTSERDGDASNEEAELCGSARASRWHSAAARGEEETWQTTSPELAAISAVQQHANMVPMQPHTESVRLPGSVNWQGDRTPPGSMALELPITDLASTHVHSRHHRAGTQQRSRSLRLPAASSRLTACHSSESLVSPNWHGAAEVGKCNFFARESTDAAASGVAVIGNRTFCPSPPETRILRRGGGDEEYEFYAAGTDVAHDPGARHEPPGYPAGENNSAPAEADVSPKHGSSAAPARRRSFGGRVWRAGVLLWGCLLGLLLLALLLPLWLVPRDCSHSRFSSSWGPVLMYSNGPTPV